MLSTLIGKCVLVSAFDLLQICRIALRPASLIAINCEQLAQNCYFPLCSFMVPGELGLANLANVIATGRLSRSIYLLTTSHSGHSVSCTVIVSVDFLSDSSSSPSCFLQGWNKSFINSCVNLTTVTSLFVIHLYI